MDLEVGGGISEQEQNGEEWAWDHGRFGGEVHNTS